MALNDPRVSFCTAPPLSGRFRDLLSSRAGLSCGRRRADFRLGPKDQCVDPTTIDLYLLFCPMDAWALSLRIPIRDHGDRNHRQFFSACCRYRGSDTSDVHLAICGAIACVFRFRPRGPAWCTSRFPRRKDDRTRLLGTPSAGRALTRRPASLMLSCGFFVVRTVLLWRQRAARRALASLPIALPTDQSATRSSPVRSRTR